MCRKVVGGIVVYSVSSKNFSRPTKNINTVNSANSEDIKKLTRYLNNQSLKDVPDSFTSTTKSALGSLAIFNGIPFVNYLIRNAKYKAGALKSAGQLASYNRQAFSNIFKGSGKITQRISNFFKASADTSAQYAAMKKNLSKIAKGMSTAEAVAVSAPPSLVGKAASGSFMKKFGSAVKNSGAIGMMAISGIIEGLTEVYPTFKELGKEKGLKQLGKSAVKVAGDTVGYLGAAKIGSAIGGLISPGVGHALGFVAGFLGSFVAGRITKAIVGKSEREIAAEQNENKNAALIAKDSQTVAKLKAAAAQKIKEESASGKLSKDSAEIAQLLNKKPTFKATV